MKKSFLSITKLVVAAIVLLCINGCKKSFLEIVPKGSLIAGKTDDYARLLTNLNLMNVSLDPQILMGDEICAIETYFAGASPKEQRLFRWDDLVYEAEEGAGELENTMTSIYTYNKVINEVMQSEDGTDQQKKSLLAEALTGRAWCNFFLIHYYGKPYNAGTASTDPGIPLVSATDVTQTTFTRNSVEEVYTQIVSDLQKAIPDLPLAQTRRHRITKAVGKALLGKVYTFMQQFDKALPQLEGAMEDVTKSGFSVQLYNYKSTFGTGGAFLPIDNNNGPKYPTTGSNEEVMLSRQYSNLYGYVYNTYVLKPEVVSLFTANDLRSKFYVSTARPSGPLPPNTWRRRTGALVQIGFVLPDLLLLRAECRARTNDPDGAISDLDLLRKNRFSDNNYLVPPDVAADNKKLLDFILEERLREFALQGYHWFDMRRLSVDPLYAGIQRTHRVIKADGSFTEYNLRKERLVMRFPQKVMDQNPNMPNNP